MSRELNRKTHIAIIIPGGVGTGAGNMGVPVLEGIIKSLARNFSLTVFSLFKVNEDYIADGFELVSIPSKNSLVKSIHFFFSFLKHYRKNKFNVVHGFWTLPGGTFAVVLGKILGIKSIVSVLGGDAVSLPEINYGQLRRWFPRKLILWTLHNASEVIVLTKFLESNLIKFGSKCKMHVIPWGIDTDQFAFRKKPFSEPIQFLHIANLSPVKDQKTLLKTFKLISDQRPSHLTIIGTGSLEQEVIKMISQYGLENKVTRVAPVPYKDLPPYFHHADILLHTSFSEGQSEVVTEAMSAGVVVCGTQVGLMYDLPDCCVSVPVGESKILADLVLQLLTNPSRLEDLQKKAHAWAMDHSISWTVEKIEKLYTNE